MTITKQALEEALTHAIFFVDSHALPAAPDARVWQLPARVLRDDPSTGIALAITVDAMWSAAATHTYNRDVEFYILDGTLTLNDVTLHARDFAYIPKGNVFTEITAAKGTRFLLFCEDGDLACAPGDESSHADPWHIVRGDDAPWVAGTVLADAGRDDIPLKIQHLKNMPDTGARTYLVAVQPGVSIPWEVHDIAEESYIVEGDYTLAECFPDGPHLGTYTEGGYFYRPAGIPHNGPASGTQKGAVMLIRTPGPLTVDLLDDCPF